jgi:hypothetical protein
MPGVFDVEMFDGQLIEHEGVSGKYLARANSSSIVEPVRLNPAAMILPSLCIATAFAEAEGGQPVKVFDNR